MGFYYIENGLVYFTLWTYVFLMMACTMEKETPLWVKYFVKWNYVMVIME